MDQPLIDDEEIVIQKKQQVPAPLPKMSRAKTLGIHMQSKRTLFQWTADGKLQEVVVQAEDIETAPEPSKAPSAFGKLSKNIPDGKSLLSGKSGKSAKSIASGNTEVAFSEQNYPVGENQEEGAILLKIQGKPGIEKRNLLVIPLLTFFLLFSSACAIQQSVTVLSEGSYGKTPTEANAINSKAGMMGALVAIPFLLVGGFLFDLMGRFKTVALLFFIMGVSIISIPLVSPSVGAYYVCRTVMQCAVSPLLVNPFVNDYVVVKQRGAGMALQSMGLTIGNILSIAALLTLTKTMGIIPGFLLSGGLFFVYVGIFWGGKMIVEPTVNEDKEGKRREKKSLLGQMRSQLRQLWKACQADKALMIGIFAVSASRFGVVMIQVTFLTWMTDLNDENDLGLTNIPALWQKQVLITQCCAIPFVVIAGKLGDKLSGKIMVPGVLAWQMIVGVAYMTVKDPTSWWAYFLAVFGQGASVMIIVVMQGYVAKRTPKMIRGITNAVMGIMGSLGSLPYLVLTGIFVKMWGARMVWGTQVLLDGLMLVFLVIMILMGKYGGEPHINDHASDRGADEGQGGYEDIPDLGPDGGNIVQTTVHHEHILEASERFEESTYRGSVVKNSMVESRRFTIDKAPDGMMDSIQIKSSMKSSSKMDDSDLVVEKRKGSYDQPLLGSFKRSVGPLVMEIEEGTDGMGSYDNNKKVRAGSYQVDPIARIVVKPKDKYAKIGTIRDSRMIKEEVGEESDDDEKQPLKKSGFRLFRSRSFDGLQKSGNLLD